MPMGTRHCITFCISRFEYHFEKIQQRAARIKRVIEISQQESACQYKYKSKYLRETIHCVRRNRISNEKTLRHKVNDKILYLQMNPRARARGVAPEFHRFPGASNA